MVCTVERKVLLDAIGAIRDVIRPNTSDMSDSSNYLIFQNGRIHAISNQFMVTVPAGIDLGDKPVSVEYQLFSDYIRKIRAKELMLGVTNSGSLGLKVGDNAKVEFATNDEWSFDDANIITDESAWCELPETFANAMQFTAWASNPSDANFSHVAVVNGIMYGHSADRACAFDMQEQGVTSFDSDVTFIHADCLNFIQKYCGFDPMRGKPKYCVKNGWLHIRTLDGVVMSSRTRADASFDVDFMEDLLKQGNSSPFRFNKDFVEALDRANPFSGRNEKSKKVNVYIRNKCNNVDAPADSSFIAITATREDGSRIYEQCLIRRIEEPITFAINHRLLTEMVKYGEIFRVGDGTITCVGSTVDGTADGKPMYRAVAMLQYED